MENVTITLLPKQSVLVRNKKVLVGDVASITGRNQALVKELRNTQFYCFQNDNPQKKVFSTLKLIEVLEKARPGVTVQALGDTSFIVELSPEGVRFFGQWWKVVFVSLAVFFGGAFSIMTFNQDVNVMDVFEMLYKASGYGKNPAIPILEIGYSIGLPVGIIVFFNHFSTLRINNDPTPLEVQMRTYEKDVNSAIMENASREGDVEDVG